MIIDIVQSIAIIGIATAMIINFTELQNKVNEQIQSLNNVRFDVQSLCVMVRDLSDKLREEKENKDIKPYNVKVELKGGGLKIIHDVTSVDFNQNCFMGGDEYTKFFNKDEIVARIKTDMIVSVVKSVDKE